MKATLTKPKQISVLGKSVTVQMTRGCKNVKVVHFMDVSSSDQDILLKGITVINLELPES